VLALKSLEGNQEDQLDLGSGSGAAGGAPDETVLVAVRAGAEPAAALEAVSLVAAVAAAAEHVPPPVAEGEGEDRRGGGWGDDAAELARLVEAADLLGAAEVVAADEDLRERHVATVGEQRPQLREEPRVHGQVPLVDGRAEPAQDGADGVAVLVGAADHAEGGEVEHHPAAAGGELPGDRGGGWGRGGQLERAEDAECGDGDPDAVENAWRGGGRRICRGRVRQEQGLDVLEGRGGEGEALGGGGADEGRGGCRRG
jgi:hypothetical protein